MARATSAADDATSEVGADPTHPYVEALTGLPGLEHVAVVDVSGQRVLGEWGGPDGSADALLERAREAAARTGRRELEDVVSTTPSAIHLSRLVLANPGHPESVWVGLRVDRAQGSLPWSRAALAGLDGPTAFPSGPRIPVQRAAPTEAPARADGPVVPGPRIVPPPPAAVPAAAAPVLPPAPSAAAVPPVHVALTARVAPPPATIAPAPRTPEAPEPARTTETVIVPVATTVELAVPPAAPAVVETVPAAVETVSAGVGAVPPAVGTVRRSSFAPVMVVAPPPSPVPDDGTTEEPAPMPAPIVYAPDPTAVPDATAVPDPTADVPVEVRAEVPVEARTDAPAVPVARDVPAVRPDAVPAAPADDDEPRVMRRLFHGLRRRP